MPKVPFEPCIPTRGTKVPAGPDWFHEIKHDGYRVIVQREGQDQQSTIEIDAMTTVAKLLARKQQLLERLRENPGPNERDEIERLLAQVDTALNLLDEAGPSETSGEQ
jgi:hypothetical protein